MESQMTVQKLDVFTLTSNATSNDEEYSIPLCIDDIISICREYNKLGGQIQNQVETILEIGIEESIKTGSVKKESLPHIKNFLKQITKNVYFGDATAQAEECIYLIENFQNKQIKYSSAN
jgi:hypothetical protein